MDSKQLMQDFSNFRNNTHIDSGDCDCVTQASLMQLVDSLTVNPRDYLLEEGITLQKTLMQEVKESTDDSN